MCTQTPAGRSHGGELRPNPLVAFWHFSHTWRLQVEPLSHWRRYYWTHREVWDTGLVAPALHNVTVKEKKKTCAGDAGEIKRRGIWSPSSGDLLERRSGCRHTSSVLSPDRSGWNILRRSSGKNWNKTLKQNNSASISCTSPSRSLFVTVVAAAGAII